MNKLINVLLPFRNEINVPEAGQEEDNFLLIADNTGSGVMMVNSPDNVKTEAIYETPTKIEDIPPELPTKTFDAKKMFGCGIDPSTKKLEESRRATVGVPGADISSMPFARYTCCAFHWKEYLSYISAAVITPALPCSTNEDLLTEMINAKLPATSPTNEVVKCCCSHGRCEEIMVDTDSMYRRKKISLTTEDTSGLVEALLSPQHSTKYSKIKSCSCCVRDDNEISGKIDKDEATTNVHGSLHELVRALSDGSLTNTSTTTVIEYETHQKDGANLNGENKAELAPPIRSLSDVFVQTSFSEASKSSTSQNADIGTETAPPFAPRRYKHKHSCRCRINATKSRRQHCNAVHRHHGSSCSHHHHHHDQHNCCTSTQMQHKMWLTSSTSEHSLSSLSSSTSTLSEASTMRSSSVLSNDATTGGMGTAGTSILATSALHNMLSASISPFGDNSSTQSQHSDEMLLPKEAAELLASFGRSPICTERLFASNAENSYNNCQTSGSSTCQSATTSNDKNSSNIIGMII